MKLSVLKNYLHTADALNFQLPTGELISTHFHITEIGLLSKHFIACGATVREEKFSSMQI